MFRLIVPLNDDVPSASEMEPAAMQKNVGVNLHSNCTVNAPEIALKTFTALKENPHATAKKLAESLGVSLRTVKNHIALLKEAGIITRVGSDKSGHWEIIN